MPAKSRLRRHENHLQSMIVQVRLTSHQACEGMMSLEKNCIHPESKKPYIRSAMGGKNNSKEGHEVLLASFLFPLFYYTRSDICS
jgi:hypothetical protein